MLENTLYDATDELIIRLKRQDSTKRFGFCYNLAITYTLKPLQFAVFYVRG
jgi:hypothetical protein